MSHLLFCPMSFARDKLIIHSIVFDLRSRKGGHGGGVRRGYPPPWRIQRGGGGVTSEISRQKMFPILSKNYPNLINRMFPCSFEGITILIESSVHIYKKLANLLICPTPWKINDTEITEIFLAPMLLHNKYPFMKKTLRGENQLWICRKWSIEWNFIL